MESICAERRGRRRRAGGDPAGERMEVANYGRQRKWNETSVQAPGSGAEFETASDPSCVRVPQRKSGHRRPGRPSNSHSILSPSCRSLADAGATRSRRVFNSPSWSSVSHPISLLSRALPANAHGPCVYIPPYPPVLPNLLPVLTIALTHRCFWHWSYHLREHSLRVRGPTSQGMRLP